MKYWQKTFLIMLTVFIVFINVCLFLTSKYSFALNLNRDTDRALSEYRLVVSSVYQTMYSMAGRDQSSLTPSSEASVMRSYADYYLSQGVTFELKRSDTVVFSNLPSGASAAADLSAPADGTYAVQTVPAAGGSFLCITGRLGGQFGDYSLTFLRELSELYTTHRQLTVYLIAVGAALESVLAVVLSLILRKLTQPIRTLRSAARGIAGGSYGERIPLRGRDEFSDLSAAFNQMAVSVQDKIDELDKNAQAKQRLIDNLAHELRTPLTAIRGYAEYLQGAYASEENRIVAAGYIISETDRVKNLALKLLEMALVRNGSPVFDTVAAPALLREIAGLSEPRLREKNLRLELECALDTLVGDGDLLQSLLLNLVDNAVKASPPGAAILLSAYFDGHPVLEVADSGCGMETSEIQLVCEPFYRIDKARSRASGGVGLGLALCRDIAAAHGAELKIDSVKGEGTKIRIVFTTPLQPSENSETPADLQLERGTTQNLD
ncbi:Signal transduction histidine kinase [Sporobacter termitidis DSM 10068]|uniref:histidine kinase n=1 Tax=Sporobacter termitidis DSM 10068 TaxID=1123282 RepID=A0A1M5YH94_9FIRM|nr:HAMP domain-containing sensor histidine kinase [Sporobacter termitidis]SHI11366.1 Signal transduction histidine kinase [Sporobacter termitidis DSM 10068]